MEFVIEWGFVFKKKRCVLSVYKTHRFYSFIKSNSDFNNFSLIVNLLYRAFRTLHTTTITAILVSSQ